MKKIIVITGTILLGVFIMNVIILGEGGFLGASRAIGQKADTSVEAVIEASENSALLCLIKNTKFYTMAKSLFSNIDNTKPADKVTHNIQKEYALLNDGKLPLFKQTDEGYVISRLMEKNNLKYAIGVNEDTLQWIPSVTDDKQDIIMYAGNIKSGETSGNINSAAIAYYDGNYYYHQSFFKNRVNEVYVGDTGQNTNTFKELASSNAGVEVNDWVKFSQPS